MSRFNIPQYENMSAENYFVNSTSVKLNETRSVRTPNKLNDFKIFGRQQDYKSYAMNHEDCANISSMSAREEDMTILNHKRCRRSVDSGIKPGGFINCRYNDQNQYDSAGIFGNGFMQNVRSVNACHAFVEKDRFLLNNNNAKLCGQPSTTQEISNIPSNTTTYSTNGTQINTIKTANTSGSSYPPQIITSSSPNIYALNDHRNLPKLIKSQNVAFSVKANDSDIHTNEDDLLKSMNPKIVNYSYDFNNFPYGSNNKIQQDYVPEYYEVDTSASTLDCSRENFQMQSPPDLTEAKLSTYQSRGETLLASNLVYPNNRYLSAMNISDPRNLISYIPVLMVSSGGSPANKMNITEYATSGMAQQPQFPNDKINIDSSNTNYQQVRHLQNTEDIESYSLQDRDTTDCGPPNNSLLVGDIQENFLQASLNSDQNRLSSYPVSKDASEATDQVTVIVSSTVDVHEQLEGYGFPTPEDDMDIKTVGKFTVKTSRDNDKLTSVFRSIENTEDPAYNSKKEISADERNKNANSDNQQPRSRFKKTRIKETIERWHIHGLNTYDCRFKVIPSKIMDLRDKHLDDVLQDYQIISCQNCGDHDSAYRCYSNEYKNKEFRFWDNGDRIAICGKSDYDTENYCQFHAKYLKLLNQNQNLSLSKFVPQNSNFPNNSPQIIRAVLISSPENENYMMNIDINVSQNVALSAPPVSPSMMNSASVSNLPPNLNSPQSSAAMVMLRCQTPVIFSNASRNASLMNETISMERINQICSPRISVDSENELHGGQPIIVTDRIGVWQHGDRKLNHLAFSIPSSTYMARAEYSDDYRTDDAVYNGESSIYHPVPHIYYSIPSEIIPSNTTGITSTLTLNNLANLPNREDRLVSNQPSSYLMQDIDDSLNSMKSKIQALVQSEQLPLINEIRSLTKVNEELKSQLGQVRMRSEYLESILKKHQVPLDLYMSEAVLSTPPLGARAATADLAPSRPLDGPTDS